MGSGRDKRKKAKGHVPGQGAEKTAKKTEKNEGKAQRRTEKRAQARPLLQTMHLYATDNCGWNIIVAMMELVWLTEWQTSLQGTDDDIDALLASFKLQDAAVASVRIEEDCPPPGPRICCSFTPLPLQVTLRCQNRHL